ncbi:hypothetical protein GF386_06225 [Candidatus Pacearchaeota archaeon]|nr:hypothetical protein [Candidatus Pacearchaeota archaeon]MBD3283685.1 hypothetical protein [Candidatus Pacearchaeota archaeon]
MLVTLEDLEQEVEGLRQLIDCNDCSDKFCCGSLNQGIYPMFSRNQLEQLGYKPKELVSQGFLLEVQGRYAFVAGKCLMLDWRGLCRVHSRKRELGLEECINFPVYIQYGDLRKLIVDYRCSSVQKNWELMADDLACLEVEIPVVVIYAHDGFYKKSSLEYFESFVLGDSL